jgi:hypothetical protein
MKLSHFTRDRGTSMCGVSVNTATSIALIGVTLGVVGVFLGCEQSVTPTPKTIANPPNISNEPTAVDLAPSAPNQLVEKVVRVKIQRGQGAEVLEGAVPWTEGLTVFDALSGVSPPIAVESTGQGESLFVQSIAGQANLGSAGDNWIYRVNGQLGDRSSGIYELEAGDQIEWSFGKYE